MIVRTSVMLLQPAALPIAAELAAKYSCAGPAPGRKACGAASVVALVGAEIGDRDALREELGERWRRGPGHSPRQHRPDRAKPDVKAVMLHMVGEQQPAESR